MTKLEKEISEDCINCYGDGCAECIGVELIN